MHLIYGYIEPRLFFDHYTARRNFLALHLALYIIYIHILIQLQYYLFTCDQHMCIVLAQCRAGGAERRRQEVEITGPRPAREKDGRGALRRGDAMQWALLRTVAAGAQRQWDLYRTAAAQP